MLFMRCQSILLGYEFLDHYSEGSESRKDIVVMVRGVESARM